MDAGDLIAAIIAALALLVSVLAWLSSRKSASASETSAAAAVRSAESAETSAVAAVRSADAAERSAEAEHALLQLEVQDRAAAELDRRMNIWEIKRAAPIIWYIRLTAAEAHQVTVETHGAPVSVERWSGGSGPMFRNDRLVVEARDESWNRRVTLVWAESDDPDAELLRKPTTL